MESWSKAVSRRLPPDWRADPQLLTIPLARERRVYLPKRQVRMLEVQLLGTPPISLLLDDQFHDLYHRAGDIQNVILV